MIGGLALVVLVLGDTIFLALSTRFLRLSQRTTNELEPSNGPNFFVARRPYPARRTSGNVRQKFVAAPAVRPGPE